MKYFSAVKKNEIMKFTGQQIDLKTIILYFLKRVSHCLSKTGLNSCAQAILLP